ncbi:MAG: hypothetical protein IIA03_13620, partial [Proteobacteria bacterium]|nr:hypothetical protein [Pseudomonadota bacterium]
ESLADPREDITGAGLRHPAAHPLQPLAELGHMVVADEGREKRHLRQREIAGRPVPADAVQDRVGCVERAR